MITEHGDCLIVSAIYCLVGACKYTLSGGVLFDLIG